MKNILVLSHCLLNTASKVREDECNLKAEYELRSKLLKLIINNDIQMIQLPCPEFLLYGSQRWGHVKEQFDNPFYLNESKKMLEPFLLQIEEYLKHKDEFNIMGIVSVEGSPSCGYHLTCSSKKWGGEISKVQDSLKMVNDSGAFMDIIVDELKKRSISVPILTMEDAIGKLS